MKVAPEAGTSLGAFPCRLRVAAAPVWVCAWAPRCVRVARPPSLPPVEELGPLIRKCLADGAMPAAALQELSHYLRCHFVPLSSPAAHQSRLPSLDMLLQRLQGGAPPPHKN